MTARDKILKQKKPVGFQHPEGAAEVVRRVIPADMPEHLNTRDLVKGLSGAKISIVTDFHPRARVQPLALDPGASIVGLRRAERNAGRVNAILGGGIDQETAPPAANVEQAFAGAQTELAADQFQLGYL